MLKRLGGSCFKFLGGLFLMFGFQAAHAQSSEMYVCIEENGIRVYQNVDLGEDCDPLRTKHISLFPPKSKVPEFSSSGSFTEKPSYASEDGASLIGSSFDFEAQTDRLQILQDELKAEERKLADLETEFNNGSPKRLPAELDDRVYEARLDRLKKEIAQTQDNIRILKQEVEPLLK